MKKLRRTMAIFLVLTMIMAHSATVFAASTAGFIDVPAEHWAAPYIAEAVELGLVHGVGDGRYDPDGILTQAQVAQILANGLGVILIQGGENWYDAPVRWLEDKIGMTVYPTMEATRGWVCQAIYLLEQDYLPIVTCPPTLLLPFSDCENHRYAPAIAFCYMHEIIGGYPDGRFGPNDSLTRAQAAKIFSIWFNIFHAEEPIYTLSTLFNE